MSEDLSILSRTANPPDATLAYGEHADQVADIRYGARGSDLPLLVLIHGGFWKLSTIVRMRKRCLVPWRKRVGRP